MSRVMLSKSGFWEGFYDVPHDRPRHVGTRPRERGKGSVSAGPGAANLV